MQWQKVREIFDSALLQKPEERRKFVNEACGADKTLLAEVESLLSSHDDAGGFMETPAVAKVAEVIEAETNRLERGHKLDHYEIVGQIGEGGMGKVYLARDQKLDRQVAIKILNERFSRDESNLIRFVREAKAASALDHPNILVIHEIGESDKAHYIVSEYVKGKTLREIFNEKALKLSDVLDVSIQIASALCTAHEVHLVHRDVKPENIMIRPDGYVKILDFGLAKLVERKGRSFIGLERSTVKQNSTAKGMILGTVNYMSTEQAKGEKVDERTDIFSLGVLIYEMITGRAPFAGDSMSETFANLINVEPQPLLRFAANVPDELQRIVSRMLRKNKDERYQTMKDVLTDLKDLLEKLKAGEPLALSAAPDAAAIGIPHVTAGDATLRTAETQSSFSQQLKSHKRGFAAAAILLVFAVGFGWWFYASRPASTSLEPLKSIAVLPFKPVNASSRDEIYETGFAEALIHGLGSMKGFIVRPLSATRKYTDIEQDPLSAGREQQVDYVLASNYQLADGRMRVTAQLFNVASGQIEETYKSDNDSDDVFKMQDAIAGDIGNLLRARFLVSAGSTPAKRGTTNEEAYRLYLQGMYFYDKRTALDAQKAIEVLEHAVLLDPNFAEAWAAKAHAHRYAANLNIDGNIHAQYQRSIEAINRSLELNPNLSEAYSALCENKMYYEYDFAGAEAACNRAIELEPSSWMAHNINARFLMSRGRFDEMIAELRTAIDYHPTSFLNQVAYTAGLTYARRNDEAVPQLERIAEMNPNGAVAYFWGLAGGLTLQANHSDLFERLTKFHTLAKTDEETVAAFRTAYQTSGWRGVVQEEAKRFDKTGLSDFFAACFYAQIEDKDRAFEYLERSYERRELWIAYIQVEPRLDSVRNDPRYHRLIERMSTQKE
ncbi:MAG: protein kinase [Pyrinomonadaceae bacterium]